MHDFFVFMFYVRWVRSMNRCNHLRTPNSEARAIFFLLLCFRVLFQVTKMHIYHAALMFLLSEGEKNNVDAWKHSYYCKEFYSTALDAYGEAIGACKIRCGLFCVEKSAWRCLYEANNDQGLITFTGLNHYAFTICLESFVPYSASYSPFSPNVKLSIRSSARGCKLNVPWRLFGTD